MSSADKKALEDIKKDIQTATTKLNDMAGKL